MSCWCEWGIKALVCLSKSALSKIIETIWCFLSPSQIFVIFLNDMLFNSLGWDGRGDREGGRKSMKEVGNSQVKIQFNLEHKL